MSERLYGDVLLTAAELALNAGESVIVDATFLRRSDRQKYERLAQRCAARFLILDCRVHHKVAAARIDQRQQQGCDPSEADLDVLRIQWEQREALSDRERTHAVVVDHNEELVGEAWQGLIAQLSLGELPSRSPT